MSKRDASGGRSREIREKARADHREAPFEELDGFGLIALLAVRI
jgi:hypothetical protein